MHPLELSKVDRILFLGAHSDDIEIGCGGAVLQLAERFPGAHVEWAVFTGDEDRAAEARESAEFFLAGFASRQIRLQSFRDGFLPWQGVEVKDFFESLKDARPDLIFTHHLRDRHQDHRLIAELTWNTFRDHLILEYEIPKYEGDLGLPNLYLPLTAEQHEKKIEGLMRFFGSQRSKDWFTPETFRAVTRLRGLECRAPSGHAEAFHAAKCSIAMG